MMAATGRHVKAGERREVLRISWLTGPHVYISYHMCICDTVPSQICWQLRRPCRSGLLPSITAHGTAALLQYIHQCQCGSH
jgi:hypothetical protein